ncbi:hypothetical protein [Naasia sp. SYSU D00948]|uniref:hypothetical protein n=1 Tax=Naasia sp. SYSU D00948 TaxID=2817379 RepID=UPI001B314EA7|nr:hypothetical protein [Naasia sp. SYSU D00948]
MTDDLAVRTSRATRAATVSLAGLGLVGALAGCSGNAGAMNSDPSGDAGTSDSATTGPDAGSSDGGSSDSGSSDGGYADGSYTEDGSYQSPGGEESITVSITLQDDVVTDVTVTPHATSGNAKQYQTQFASGIADQVVGKDIDSLNVSRVAGSSLTSGGFNDALEKIKADAAE